MSRTKIKNLSQIQKVSAALRAKGKKIVFTNGCFDILHYGHVMYLKRAKERGDILIVALNSDSSVKKIKGPGRPILNQHDRSAIIAALASVDYVVIFNQDTPLEVIKKVKPDILIKGSDWGKNNIVGADFVKSCGGKVSTITLAKGRSTTDIINKVIEKYKNR